MSVVLDSVEVLHDDDGEVLHDDDDGGAEVAPRQLSRPLVVLGGLGSEFSSRGDMGGQLGHELDKALAFQRRMEHS